MAWQVLAAMAASTAVTLMGQRQQMKTMKANAAWQNYENELSFQYEKQKTLKAQSKLMSKQRATIGASGAQFTGSPLITSNADFEEFESDLWYMEKRFFVQNAARDAELTGLLTAQKYKMGQTLLSGASSATNYKYNNKAANTTGTTG